MNKSHPIRYILPVLLLLLVGVVFLRRATVEDEPKPEEKPIRESVTLEAFAPYQPDAPTAPDTVAVDEVPLPAPAEDAIPGEYTVTFRDRESMEAFLKEAEDRGVRILGSIPDLLSLRVGASASQMKAMLTEGLEIDNNYVMKVPPLPDLSLWRTGSLSAFNDQVLAYLGVPVTPDRLSWGKGVTIAVLDTGWLGHSSMTANRVRLIDLIEGSQMGEFSGHGTAVTGLIGSADPFAPGIAPGSELVSIRVLDGEGQGNAFTLAQGIMEAVNAGADIINMSLGGYGDSDVLRQAVAYAAERGVFMVAASGNDGAARLTYPAGYSSVVGVTAVDASGNRPSFANFGEGLDMAAPGFQINALWAENEFIYFNGTSAASPLVAGMAARIIQSGAANTPDQIREVILTQSNDTGLPGPDTQYGAGILNAERIESIGKSGIFDIALADLYPAVELSDGNSFPLYVSLQNRGTDYIPSASVELEVNGRPYYYRFFGLDPGAVQSIQLPVTEALLSNDRPYEVQAKVTLPDRYEDSRPGNNAGSISLTPLPEE